MLVAELAVFLRFGHGNNAPPTMHEPVSQRTAMSPVPGADHLSVLVSCLGQERYLFWQIITIGKEWVSKRIEVRVA